MKDAVTKVLNEAIFSIMRPLVRILLRNGVAYGNFVEIVRKVYVDVAYENLVLNDKRPTISAISGITGLTRKEAKRLNEVKTPHFDTSDLKYNRAARVISAWQNDKDFQTSNGKPKPLQIDGKNSFGELVKKYSGDIPAVAMLSILRDSNCITEIEGKVHLISSSYISDTDPIEKIQILGIDTSELLETINHNLSSEVEDLWYQRKVSNYSLDTQYLDEFRKIAAEKSQSLLEELDKWLSDHEAGEKDGTSNSYVALGTYYFEDSQMEKGNEN